MLDYEDGPHRKVSRTRKRSSTTLVQNSLTTSTSDKKRLCAAKDNLTNSTTKLFSPEKNNYQKKTPEKSSPVKPGDWFCNSFVRESSLHQNIDGKTGIAAFQSKLHTRIDINKGNSSVRTRSDGSEVHVTMPVQATKHDQVGVPCDISNTEGPCGTSTPKADKCKKSKGQGDVRSDSNIHDGDLFGAKTDATALHERKKTSHMGTNCSSNTGRHNSQNSQSGKLLLSVGSVEKGNNCGVIQKSCGTSHYFKEGERTKQDFKQKESVKSSRCNNSVNDHLGGGKAFDKVCDKKKYGINICSEVNIDCSDSFSDMFGDSFHEQDVLSQIDKLEEKFGPVTMGHNSAVIKNSKCDNSVSCGKDIERRKSDLNMPRTSIAHLTTDRSKEDECATRQDVADCNENFKQTCVGKLDTNNEEKSQVKALKFAPSNSGSKPQATLPSRPLATQTTVQAVGSSSHNKTITTPGSTTGVPCKSNKHALSTDVHVSSCKQQTSNHILRTSLTNRSKTETTVSTTVNTQIAHTLVVNNAGDFKPSVVSSSTPVTPGGGGTLQERIKQRLKENAGVRTPQGTVSLVERLREEVLERAQQEAAQIQSEGTMVDIGPFYGLPSKVQQLLQAHRGIKGLYDWQDECLKLPAVLEGKNLIYSLPTSGGKTLVAEILILREILCKKRDALLILPFVSIVQEKVRNLSQFALDLDFLVEEYAGSKGKFPPIARRKKSSLFIATIEKGHSIVNSLVEKERMNTLGLVVVDELHMIGEGGSRGATLEATLMKILHSPASSQIIGMSATLSNIGDLAKFLNAEVYTNNFRPVELTEYVKLDDNIYSVDTKCKCVEDQFLHDRVAFFQYLPEMNKQDPDQLLGLVLEVIPGNSCLLFCPTKKNCENVAMMLAKMMVKYKRELSGVKKTERKSLLKELYNDADGKICPVLQYTIHFGIAYHHSGLTMDERKLIEEAYSEGVLCLLTCTSTLAAGVNLPAKRVILRGPYVGSQFISRSQYKQMVGRAGRAGIDTSGESILITKPADRERVAELMASPMETCHSSLMYDGGKGIRNLMLSTIGLKITPTTEDVFTFARRSLMTVQKEYLDCDLVSVCKESLQKLLDLGLVVQRKVNEAEVTGHSLEVTAIGRAAFKGPIDPDYASVLFADLKKAEESLVLSSHLHLLYLVTPYDVVKDVTPSWYIYFSQMNAMDAVELKVATLIGVPESYIAKKAGGQRSKQKVVEFVVNRFYLTLMLYDLWKQKSIWEVADKFQQSRGFVQNLLSAAASFASCVFHFCQELDEFWAFQDLMGNFVKRLSYCVSAELIPLVEIPGVKLGRAKMLYSAGFKTLSAVANSDPEDLVHNVKYMPRKVAKQVVASAKVLLNEKTEALIEEVEELVAVPPGIEKTGPDHHGNVTPAPSTPGFSQGSSIDSQQSVAEPL